MMALADLVDRRWGEPRVFDLRQPCWDRSWHRLDDGGVGDFRRFLSGALPPRRLRIHHNSTSQRDGRRGGSQNERFADTKSRRRGKSNLPDLGYVSTFEILRTRQKAKVFQPAQRRRVFLVEPLHGDPSPQRGFGFLV